MEKYNGECGDFISVYINAGYMSATGENYVIGNCGFGIARSECAGLVPIVLNSIESNGGSVEYHPSDKVFSLWLHGALVGVIEC